MKEKPLSTGAELEQHIRDTIDGLERQAELVREERKPAQQNFVKWIKPKEAQ